MEKLRFKKAQNQEWRSKSALPGAAGLQQDGCEFQANRSYTRGAPAFQNRSGGGEKSNRRRRRKKKKGEGKESGEQSSNWWRRLNNLPFFVVELRHNSNLSMGMT